MKLLGWMQPRDPGAAIKVVASLAAVSVVVTVAFLPVVREDIDRSRPELIVLCVIALVAVVLVAGAAWAVNATNRLAWTVCPFLAIAVIVVIDLATFDASLAAQIFFLFPTLYAATLLPRQGAALVTGACVLGELTVVLANLSVPGALIDAGYLSAALITTSVLLARGAERQVVLTAELEHRATTDALTGLVNRRTFDTATRDALSHTPRATQGTALVLLDIDLFKAINDQYGHPGGDQVLIQLAELLVTASRHGDVVCRLGGDELAVLMPGCSVEVARRRAEQMVEAVREHAFTLALGEVATVSITVGVAHTATHTQTPDALYAAADEALYEAKRAGRDRVITHALAQ